MLKGHFENCYGLENFDMLPIPFSPTENKAILYAPNGVMKSSFAQVFDNLSRKKKTEDRIYSENPSTFSVEYYDETFNERLRRAVSTMYVISSFNASFESQSDSVATILADEDLKREYAAVMGVFSEKMQPFVSSLKNHCSAGYAFEAAVSDSFGCTANDDWASIIGAMGLFLEFEKPSEVLASVRYDEIFNTKVLKVISSPDFSEKIAQYISVIDTLLHGSRLFNSDFDDNNAREFGSTVAKTKLFNAHHRIMLSDGTIISSMDEWQALIDGEMERINSDESAQTIYSEIDRMLNANVDTRKLREIIKANRMLLTYFDNLTLLKKRLWVSYLAADSIDVVELSAAVQTKETEISALNERANEQLAHWRHVINVFTERFRAPFIVSIDNESKVVLKGEPAHLVFKYNRNGQLREKTKEELMACMSVGEKRALYLLQILFDLEKIKASTGTTGKKHLVIADDIADSFDYTNKYAIIEYLDEIASNKLIDLLILTHNFDFYRTVSSRLDIGYKMCFVAQKGNDGTLSMREFAYKKDFFTKGIIEKLRDGKIGDDFERQKLVIASIPFCRNIAEYMGDQTMEDALTGLLHIKPNTLLITLGDYWSVVKDSFHLEALNCAAYIGLPLVDMIFDLADRLTSENQNTVSLEDKLVMSIAIRLKSEMFLKKVLIDNNIELACSSNQTRTWMRRAEGYVSTDEYGLLNTVGLITPESIHVNAFMYEPLIDIPNWQLFTLYIRVKRELTV